MRRIMSFNSVVFRCDANVAAGTGHVMRCLALAQAWQAAGGRTVFAMSDATSAMRTRLLSEGVEVVPIEAPAASADDARQVKDLARQHRADWVALDGYHFNVGYQRELKSAGPKVLVLDDDGTEQHGPVDLILNQNSNAREDLYAQREPHTRLLLGTRYALLRREFVAWREWKRDTAPTACKLLVTMGGSDPDNLTSLAIHALSMLKTEGLRSTVVAGGSNPHRDSLQRLVSGAGRSITLQESVSNMPELMAEADVAIIAAGGTLWELLYMSCPILSFARNLVQARILDSLQREGVVQYLGDPQHFEPAKLAQAIDELATSFDRRARMSKLGRQQVDGQGARRVCEVLAALN